jgi:sigma-B regulation protein RsbU (phosphoserine phosphatase)
MFVTVFYGILNTQTGEVNYVNAGHNPPYLISSNKIEKVEMTDGMALGVMNDFEYKSKTLQLKKDDKLVLSTDGVVEAFDREETAYGEERFEHYLITNCNHPIEKIIKNSFDDVCGFVDGAPQSDDITLLGLTYKG